MSGSRGSKDNTIVAIGVGVFLIIFALIGYSEGIDKGKRDNSEIATKIHQEDAAERIERTCIGLDVPAFTECVQDAVTTSGEYQRAHDDLQAQQQMAELAIPRVTENPNILLTFRDGWILYLL
jgi:hypothetical protein